MLIFVDWGYLECVFIYLLYYVLISICAVLRPKRIVADVALFEVGYGLTQGRCYSNTNQTTWFCPLLVIWLTNLKAGSLNTDKRKQIDKSQKYCRILVWRAQHTKDFGWWMTLLWNAMFPWKLLAFVAAKN